MADWIDLHVHSTASDGTCSPKEVVMLAKQAGLVAIALTDHDTVLGVEEAVSEGKKQGIKVIPGVECSAVYHGEDVHILGYGVDIHSEAFLENTKKMNEMRTKRNAKMIQKLSEAGFCISEKVINETFPDAVVTRAHFARYLYDTHQIKTLKEAFEKYIGTGCPCYIPKEEITPKQVIELIKRASGKPVLAHPMLYHMTRTELEKLVTELCEYGLLGIEAVYSTYSYDEETFVKRLAKEKGLFITGGSDFHGNNKPNIKIGRGLGHLYVPADFLETLGF